MKILSRLTLLVALLLPVTAGTADASDFDLLKAMSAADFRAAGLNQLSDAQLKNLSAWFAQYQHDHPAPCATPQAAAGVATPAVAASPVAAKPAAPAQTEDTFPLHATLVGDFRGWNGATTFTLDNGEVWEQIDDDSFSSASIPHPKVTISKGSFYSFVLSVEGVKETVMVKRIKP